MGGGEVEVGTHPRHRRGLHRLEGRREVAEAGERHRVDEGLAAGEGRVEHWLGDAEFAGEAAHRDGGPAAGLGEVAGGADDLIAAQGEIGGGSGWLGTRFLLTPARATLDFGVAADNLRALTAIKAVRDIASGLVLLVVWAAAGRTALGWALVAAAFTPVADAVIVLTNGGKRATALGVHGVTAAVLVAAGLILALG
ncbi:hypothetical protein Asp14428_14490 [Actinoplanes sp. NBRC 14428]|nr:hypothetical protein Asp14428_14490 [Actinoplanes sp. NBRC 14428]